MIKNLIFDLGGVIENLHMDRAERAFREIGMDLTKAIAENPNIVKTVMGYINGFVSEPEVAAVIRPYCSPDVTDEQIMLAMLAECGDIPVARLEALKGLRSRYKVYLLSNISERFWLDAVQKMNAQGYSPEDCFDRCFLSYEMQLAKPDAGIYQQVVSETGIRLEETLYFDDRKENVEAGKTAGFHAVMVDTNFLERTEEWNKVISGFRPMRRFRQQLPEEETVGILEKATSGTLALLGDNGYPYAVPISYVYADGKLYFHSALSGHKVDAIRRCDKASFCVIAQDDVVPEKYTTEFRSVIAFGRIHIIEDEREKMAAARMLGDHYNPHQDEALQKEIESGLSRMLAIRFDIEHLSGKEGIELTKRRSTK